MTTVEIPAADSVAERYGRRHRRVEDHQPTTVDEALEAAGVIADSELEGAVVMLLRVNGVLMLVAG